MRIYFVPSANNTGNTTINIGQTVGTLLGSKKALTLAGGQLPSGALLASRLAAFTYDASADGGTGAWILDGSYDASSGQFLPLTGGTMSGAIAMGNNKVTGLAAGTVSGDAVHKGQLDLKADLASPALTGTPTAPTAAVATDSTQIATTEFVKDAGLGWNQTWQNVTGSRSVGTEYTNSTGKPIAVSVWGNVANSNRLELQVNDGGGFVTASYAVTGAVNNTATVSAIVPAGHTYRIASGGATPVGWAELR